MENQRTDPAGVSTFKACEVLHAGVHVLADQYDLEFWPDEPRLNWSGLFDQLSISTRRTSESFALCPRSVDNTLFKQRMNEIREALEKGVVHSSHWDIPSYDIVLDVSLPGKAGKTDLHYGPPAHDKRKNFKRQSNR